MCALISGINNVINRVMIHPFLSLSHTFSDDFGPGGLAGGRIGYAHVFAKSLARVTGERELGHHVSVPLHGFAGVVRVDLISRSLIKYAQLFAL